MSTFIWEGTSSDGKTVTGEIEAKDALSVFNILRAQKIVPNASKIKEKGKGLSFDQKREKMLQIFHKTVHKLIIIS